MIDGYANGWRIDGSCVAARMAFAPQSTTNVAFAVSAVGCVMLLLAAVGLRMPSVLRRRLAARRMPRTAPAMIPLADTWTPVLDERLRRVPWPRALAFGVVVGAVTGVVFAVRFGAAFGPLTLLTGWARRRSAGCSRPACCRHGLCAGGGARRMIRPGAPPALISNRSHVSSRRPAVCPALAAEARSETPTRSDAVARAQRSLALLGHPGRRWSIVLHARLAAELDPAAVSGRLNAALAYRPDLGPAPPSPRSRRIGWL